MPSNVDLKILLELNSLVPQSHLGAKLFYFPADNALVRGFPIFFPLSALWFSPTWRSQRGRILIGLLTGCVATIFSVWLQSHTHFNVRPFLDPNLHLRGMELITRTGWDHLCSFPSDTATLLFAFSTVVFLQHKLAGVIAFIWSFFISGIIRVAVGWHYPSDVAAAFILGCCSVLLLTRVRYLTHFVDELLQRAEPRIYIVHALMFFLLADALSLFYSGLQFLHGIRDIAHFILQR
ncbi:MAG TPA: phosphatase PAP2 family protein [Terracidiphilus sp.]